MCKYIYHDKENKTDTPCQFQLYFSLKKESETVPVDDSGYCIFHSENIKWKKKNQFHDYFIKLLEIILLVDKGEIEYEAPNGFLDFDLRGVNWIGNTSSKKEEKEIQLKDINLIKPISLIFHGGFFFDSVFIDKINAPESTIDLSSCTFNNIISITSSKLKDLSLDCSELKGGIDIAKCEISELAQFYKMHVQEGFIIHSSTFSDETQFLHSFFETNYFSLDNVIFEGKVDFSYCTFNHYIYIENCSFGREVFFNNAKLRKEATIHLNLYESNVYFISDSPDNKIFEDVIYLDIKEEELNGLINFENVNFLNIAQNERENLLKLEKVNKVKIGKGCIKYRIQSPIIKIDCDQINQNIIVELTNSFSNYFLHSEGFNLGVEFVDKQIGNLQLFYYTDELISKDEFIARLKLAEKDYWNFTIDKSEKNKVKQIQNVDTYSSKISVLLKIAARKEFGFWSDIETNKILESISFNEKSIEANQINLLIDNLNLNLQPEKMEIKKINVSEGGQVNIAERIDKIEFSPNLFKKISENDFNSLKRMLSSLSNEEISGLRKDVEAVSKENISSEKMDSIKKKVANLLSKHAIPISQSLTASSIFEFLNSFLF